MQPGTPGEWAEMRRAIGAVVANLEVMNRALMRHTTASTFALVFLMQELEARGGLDRAALVERMLAGLRSALPEDPETEQAVRDLFGQGESPGPPARPRLRVVEGGKCTPSPAHPRRLVALPDPT